jgi:hypothetical protein
MERRRLGRSDIEVSVLGFTLTDAEMKRIDEVSRRFL